MDHTLAVGDRAVITHNVCHLWQGQRRQENERVTQALLGARVTVVASDGAWVRVEMDDTYRGWTEARWLAPLPKTTKSVPITTPFAELQRAPSPDSPLLLRLSLQSTVTVLEEKEDWARVGLPGGEQGWLLCAALEPRQRRADETVPAAAVRFARQFLGTPYLWGGSSSFGLDCSGLVQLCYRLAGMILRRDADIQRSDARFTLVEDAHQPGDLLFFGSHERITHVGMHYAEGVYIHSAGGAGVLLTEWDDPRYASRFVDARRLLPGCVSDPVVRHEDPRR